MTALIAVPHAYWVVWVVWVGLLGLVGFAVPEALALKNKVPGDTLSERVRAWFRADTSGGGWTFAGVWTVLLAVWLWFLGHILQWWA